MKFKKHIIAILVTSGFIAIPYFIITLPLVGVFIIDKATTVGELVAVYFCLVTFSIGIPALIFLPINLLFDYLSRSHRMFRWIIPILLIPLVNSMALIYCMVMYNDFWEMLLKFLTFFYLSILFLLYRLTNFYSKKLCKKQP